MSQDVLITGLGMVTALGQTAEATWQAVLSNRSGVTRLDGARWPTAPLPEFDSPDDPFIIAARIAAREALDDSGAAGSLPAAERMGCTISSSKGGVRTLERAMADGRGLAEDWLGQISPSAAGARVAREFGIRGPVVCLGTGCAAGVHSVITGARWIRDGRCDVVLAGAVDASATALIVAGFGQMGVLTRDGVRPFDVQRSGFALGEGAAVLVLESEGRVRARGGRAYGRIVGFSDGADPYAARRFEPSGGVVSACIAEALERLPNWASRAGYINAHGTATRANDCSEAAAIRSALRDGWREVPVSSTKGATGHLLAAAGAVELGIALLAMRDQVVPATLGLRDIDPACELRHVVGEPIDWPCEWVMSISMALGGHIGLAVIERWDG